MTLIP